MFALCAEREPNVWRAKVSPVEEGFISPVKLTDYSLSS